MFSVFGPLQEGRCEPLGVLRDTSAGLCSPNGPRVQTQSRFAPQLRFVTEQRYKQHGHSETGPFQRMNNEKGPREKTPSARL